MRYDLDKVRRDNAAYQRRFNDQWLHTYGVTFDGYYQQARRNQWLLPEYQRRIKFIKSIIK